MHINGRCTIFGEMEVVLSELEARALVELTRYGTDPFLKYFYTQFGTDGLKPVEAGLRSLFEHVKMNMPAQLRRIDAARKVFNNTK